MGMTIKELLLNLHAIQDYYNDDAQDGYVGFNREDNESMDLAIQIIQKYQKIEQLIADYEEYKWERGVVCKREITVKDIREVVENGNDD